MAAEQLDQFHVNAPAERKDLNLDLTGMTRATAEMIRFDASFKTKPYLEADMWQQVHATGFMTVTTERVPFYSLEVDFEEIQDPAAYEEDKVVFQGKWGFVPSVVRI
jgi:hypothetical protein